MDVVYHCWYIDELRVGVSSVSSVSIIVRMLVALAYVQSLGSLGLYFAINE